ITEALDQGVPMLILPFSTDQFDGAAALETAGMGLAADPNAATPAELHAAISRLLARRPQGLTALAESLSAEPGPQVALRAVGALSEGASLAR
ncbi:MAG: glycosyltransferase, partial [Candidatus Limnocylindria bacterium]